MAGKPRKKVEPIVGMADESKLTVQKSVPLHALWKSDLTLAEFKILDMYLSRIDSHKPEKRLVKLSKGEVEQALGVQKISTQNLKERLKHLMGNVVEIQDKDMKKGFRLVTLFDEAVAEQDSNGLWEVRLECTQKAMKYFFNIESLGYFRYKLRCVTSMTSRYTYIMFSYLEAHRRMGLSWEVSLGELKQILACDQEETYKEYKRFNDLILKKVQKELLEKTECRYSYEPVKKGRFVVAVRFTLEPLAKAILDDNYDPNQYTLDDWQKDQKQEKRDAICHGFDAEEFDEFTDEQLEALKELAWGKWQEADLERHKQYFGVAEAAQWATSDYLRKAIAMAKTRKPKNLFLYVKKMVETDE